MRFKKIKPGMSRRWLLLFAGVTWSVVGVTLCVMATRWLMAVPWAIALPLGWLGVVAAIATFRWGFSKLAKRNIERIGAYSEPVCVFAFQAWKSYFLILLMVALGITLRHSPMPRHYWAVVYATMGGALFLSSFRYYARIRELSAQGGSVR